MSKLLVIDIETKPALVYTFQAYDTNIGPDQVVNSGGLLCFCAHWVGSKEYLFYSEWEHGNLVMAAALRDLLDEADAVIGYNSNKFDLPKIRGHILMEGLKDFAPPTTIDLIKTVKKFGFIINKLAYIGPLLGVGNKLKHEGFSLWRSVMEGDEKAQKRMQRYCVQDVRVTAKLYKRIKAFIMDHPNLSDEGGVCGNCGSHHLHNQGFRRTKYYKTQRLQCQDCGAWSTGSRSKLP